MVAETESASSRSPRPTRRRFIKGVTVGTVGLATGGTGTIYFQTRPVAADVTAWDVVSFGAIDAAAWLLRESDILGGDAPPSGLTADALKDKNYDIGLVRQSTNQSSILDTQNLSEFAKQPAYTKAKTKAIEAINEQLSQSEVETAATDAVNSYEKTVLGNLLKTWNESAREYETLALAVKDHPDLGMAYFDDVIDNTSKSTDDVYLEPESYTFSNGDTMDVERICIDTSDSSYDYTEKWSPIFHKESSSSSIIDGPPHSTARNSAGEVVRWNYYDEWSTPVTNLETLFSDLRDEVILWVDNLYSQVQSGSIDTSDIITPSMQAEMLSEDEDYPQAYADLMALNIPVDTEREATISIPSVGATLRGTLAVTDSTISLEVGTEYDPDADISGSVYLTYDVAAGTGEWASYETAVDGGTVTFTEEPHGETEYVINTTAGESASVVAGDFTFDDTNSVWTVDISSQVDTAITEVDTVEYYPETTETRYETIQLTEPFTVESFEDSEGNTYDAANFERPTEPQTDTNYITQEEWDEMQQRNEELIDKYEESQNTGGGGAGGSSFWSRFAIDLGPLGVIPGTATAAVGAAGAGYAYLAGR